MVAGYCGGMGAGHHYPRQYSELNSFHSKIEQFSFKIILNAPFSRTFFQMPRVYSRQTEKANWDCEQLKAALGAIRNGRSIREVSRAFNIPRSTLQKRLKQNSDAGPSLGRKPVFSTVEEKCLAEHVIHLSKLFYGISRQEIKKCAYDYALKNNLTCPFNRESKSAGNDWLWGFMKRNPSIALRKPEPTSINRITAFCKEEVSIFFNNLAQLQEKFNFKSHRIFNTDETGISTVQTPGKILARKGLKQVGFATSWERGRNITVVCAFSATGIYVPPMFIYARKRMNPQLQKNGPAGALYTCSDKGWITEELFVQYLSHFQKFVKASQEDPVLLIMDNHSTHCTLQVHEFCKANGIALLSIPPHTSHKIQPLDVSFYGPLKSAYNSECSKYLRNHPHEKITPFEVAELFNNAFIRVATPEKAIKGFQATGICPYNPDVFTAEDFEPAALQNQESPSVLVNNHPVTGELQVTPEKEIVSSSLPPPCEKSTKIVEQSAEPPSEIEMSFLEILPLPGPSKSSTGGTKRKNTKQHSQIITSTPYKDVLQEKADKKRLAQEKHGKQGYKRKVFSNDNNDDQSDIQEVKKRVNLPRAKTNRKTYQEISSGDEDNDDEEKDKDADGSDICLVCGEFGKNGELWLRCNSCGNWAHKACTDNENKAYICDYCA